MRRRTIQEHILAAGVLLVVAGGCARENAMDDNLPRIERHDDRIDALLAQDATVELVADGFTWVEGPVWSVERGSLLFSEIPSNAIMEWNEATGARVFLQPSGYTGNAPFEGREPGSNGLAFDGAGRLILAEHGDRRVTRLETDGFKTVLADRYQGSRLNSPNDVAIHPDGSIYFTDPPFGLPQAFNDEHKELPFQGVYRIAPDGVLTLLIDDIRAPNGITFSPDARTLYVSNSDRNEPSWYAYDVQRDGTLANPRLFHDASNWVEQYAGGPDGMKTDRAGNLFASGPGGVYIFTPDGTHLGSIILGGATSNVGWGGADGHDLFITAGTSVYRVRTSTGGTLTSSRSKRNRRA